MILPVFVVLLSVDLAELRGREQSISLLGRSLNLFIEHKDFVHYCRELILELDQIALVGGPAKIDERLHLLHQLVVLTVEPIVYLLQLAFEALDLIIELILGAVVGIDIVFRILAGRSLEAIDFNLMLLDARVCQPCKLLCVLELRIVREGARLHQVGGPTLDRLSKLLEEWSEPVVQLLHHGLLVEVASAHLQPIVLTFQFFDGSADVLEVTSA